LPDSISQDALLQEIRTLNDNHMIHGLLIQLPLPSHIDERVITEAIDPKKDVDGFHSSNIGELAKKGLVPSFLPCTPIGVMELLRQTGVELSGKNAVVVGRSNIVGMPVALLLQQENATVTVCHSKTVGLEKFINNADVVVAAVGVPNLIKGTWLKKGAVVIDVGTNAVPDSTKKSGIRWVGDVEYETALPIVSAITPVPGIPL
jgi:methylenetetrahydrofolate dehydrogenase (NADP+)/methenyltetrahydrofolate cyclohydrolase/formyltetrahydrofolate synthetase